jgi:hypothetical protein
MCVTNPCYYDGVCSQRGIEIECDCINEKTGKLCQRDVEDALRVYSFNIEAANGLYFQNDTCQERQLITKLGI